MSKITAKKYEGDDAYSWAVFIDGVPFVTGLTREEIPHYKKKAKGFHVVRSAMNGASVLEEKDTPFHCSVRSEHYWCC